LKTSADVADVTPVFFCYFETLELEQTSYSFTELNLYLLLPNVREQQLLNDWSN
jgi:hypothetical protein